MQQGEIRVTDFCSKAPPGFAGTVTEPYEVYVEACYLICKLYILVDYLCSHYWEEMEKEILAALTDMVLTAACFGRTIVVPKTVLRVFRNTGEGSALRKFVREEFCSTFARMANKFPALEEYGPCMAEFPVDFGVEVMKRVVNGFHHDQFR